MTKRAGFPDTWSRRPGSQTAQNRCPCDGLTDRLTQGRPELAFLNPVWETVLFERGLLSCQVFTSLVYGSAPGSLGRSFCVSQGWAGARNLQWSEPEGAWG